MNNEKSMINYKEKLHQIKAFVFDFDGVLSDGMIYTQSDGEMVRGTNAKDGYALQYALKKGYKVAIISGGFGDSMRQRYRSFPAMDIFLHVSDKIELFNQYLADNGFSPENVLVMGDDIPDYQIMKLAGVKCCPADAAEEIKKQFPNIKIIIVTSMPEYSWLERARKIGVDSFWYKDGHRLRKYKNNLS